MRRTVPAVTAQPPASQPRLHPGARLSPAGHEELTDSEPFAKVVVETIQRGLTRPSQSPVIMDMKELRCLAHREDPMEAC